MNEHFRSFKPPVCFGHKNSLVKLMS